MSIFDRLKNHLEDPATATPAISATDAIGTVAEIATIAVATSTDEKTESPSLIPLPVVVASDGRVLAWASDPPHIRVYSWSLQTLMFVPVNEQTAKSHKIPSGEVDGIRIRKLAAELRMTEQEVQSALNQLVREGDLECKTERSRRVYWLSPLRY